MDILWVCSVLVAVVVGAFAGASWARSAARHHAAGDVAAARAERDLLASQLDAQRIAGDDDRAVAAELAPLRATLDRVASHVTTLERDRVEQYGQLSAVLRSVAAGAEALGQETSALSGALNSSGVRGAWGEAQLRRVLEHAGMLPRCDFDEQVSATSRHDANVRPDVVVHLPGTKSLVIDAKAPLTAFLQAQGNQISPSERDQHLQQHAAAVRRHVEALASKEYWSAFADSPELVICFVPSDAVLASALQTEPDLYDYAQSRKVVLASPATLLAILRATAFAWQQEALQTNAAEVLRLGNDLHSRLGTLGQHVQAMGTSLTKSVDAYNRFVGTLETRVMVTSRKMVELDVVSAEHDDIPVIDTSIRRMTHADLLAAELDAAAPPREAIVDQSSQRPRRQRRVG
ncbi:MAG: DNA recombination protein RmuC [Ornithinimicrobium sp.]